MISETEIPVLLKTFEGRACRLTLNRPKVYNALSLELVEALITEFMNLINFLLDEFIWIMNRKP